MARLKLLLLVNGMLVSLLALAGCGSDPHDSKSFKALNGSRGDVIDAAKKIRSDSRAQSQPSGNYYGSFRPCSKKGMVHYNLETDWITPKSDEDDLRVFNYVANVLKGEGWADHENPSQRRRLMKRGSLEILIYVNPGASWITGFISSACYSVTDTASEFLKRRTDYLHG